MAQRLRSFVRFLLWGIASVLGVLVIIGAGLALRLASAPIDTPVPQALLDRVVAEAAPGWHVAAGGAQLDFSSNDGLNGLKLRDVVLSDAEGTQIVSAPVLGLKFAFSASLDTAEAVTIREVALTGASVDVIRDRDGTFALALGDISGGGENTDPFAALNGLGDLGDLPRLRIEDAQVRYSDEARGTTWRTERARLTLTPSSEGLAGTLGVVVDGGIGGAQVDVLHTAATGEVTAALVLDGVRPSRVAELDPILAQLSRVDAPLSGTVNIVADDGGSFRSVSGAVTASSGTVTLGEQAEKLNLFAAVFSCDIAARGCDVSDLSVDSETFRGNARATLREGAPGSMAVALTLSNAFGQVGDLQVNAAQAEAAATLDIETGRLVVDRMVADGVSLNGLPEGMSVSASRVGGAATVDPDTAVLTLPALLVEDFAIVDATGRRQSVARVQAGIAFNHGTSQMSVSDMQALDVSIAGDGVAVRVGTVAGAANVDLLNSTVALKSLALSDAHVIEGEADLAKFGTASLSGVFDVPAQTLRSGAVHIRNAAIALPDLYAKPVQVSEMKASLAAAHEEGAMRLTLNEAVASVDGLPATAQGNFALRPDGTALGRLDVSLGPVSMAKVPQHWPMGVAPGGLRWFADNVRGGVADSLTISAQFDEARPDQDSLDLRFDFRDAVVGFAPGMPPIEQGVGVGKVTLKRFDLSLTSGSVATPNGGPLSVGGSTFAIADFAPDIPDGQVQLRASGNVQSVLRMLDTEPLGVISPTGFDIAQAQGQADVRVLLDLPLAEDLRIDDVRFDARAKIHKYSLREPQTNAVVSGDLLLVKANPDGMTLQSDARIEGLAARLGYSQSFERPGEGEPDSVLTLESFLTLGDFARHGLVLDDYVEGLTAMKARIELFPGGAARINADADLTNLTLKAERLGWAKPAGVPATIRMSGFRNRDGAGRIEALALRGEGMSADGSVGFGAQGQISRANFSRIVLGTAVDVGLIYGRKTNGNIGILLKGAKLDLRKAFADAIEGDGAPKRAEARGPETDISVEVGRVFLRDALAVFDLKGALRLRDGDLFAANIEGKLNGSASTKLLAERRSDGLAIRLNTPDAGGFIRATDVFSGAYDGALQLDAITNDTVTPSQISGRILVTNMVVHDAPTLGKILSGGAIGSLLSDLANGGIKFTKIELPFRGVGSRWQIEDGVAFGPQIGLTLDGGYDLAQSMLALTGSISPAYAINGAVGNVPLLGRLLTGGEGEGVFGVTFSVNGMSSEPVVNVNPLSALAPGFLRKIIAEVGKAGAGKSFESNERTTDR